MAKKDFNEYNTPNGVFKWSQKLSPREKSGKVGSVCVGYYIPIELAVLIQQKTNSLMVSRSGLDVVMTNLVKLALQRFTPAELTPVIVEQPQPTSIVANSDDITVSFRQLLDVENQKRATAQMPVLTILEIQNSINSCFQSGQITAIQQQQLLKHYVVDVTQQMAQPQPVFNF